jgi:hypothetical protein
MPKEELVQRRLSFMLARHWLWNSIVLTVKDVRQTEERVYLTTSVGLLDYSYDEFLEIGGKAKELSEPLQQNRSKALAKVEGTKGLKTLDRLNDNFDAIAILKDSISRIRVDAGFIKQSEAINRVIKTALEIAKTEMQINKMESR